MRLLNLHIHAASFWSRLQSLVISARFGTNFPFWFTYSTLKVLLVEWVSVSLSSTTAGIELGSSSIYCRVGARGCLSPPGYITVLCLNLALYLLPFTHRMTKKLLTSIGFNLDVFLRWQYIPRLRSTVPHARTHTTTVPVRMETVKVLSIKAIKHTN